MINERNNGREEIPRRCSYCGEVDGHGFTSVDSQPCPSEWVDVLDRLSTEPFYIAYKARLLELLRPARGQRYVEVGAGAGDAARTVRAHYGAEVIGLDCSLTMARQARERGLARVLVADGHRLPLGTDRLDGGWADRVLQHLAEPEQALDELVRVVRPGGRIALADPDYDTAVLDIEDQELARRVMHFRARVALRNGALAHRHAGLLAARGLRNVAAEAHTLLVRDPRAVDNVLGLRTWAHTAATREWLTVADADRFVRQFDAAVRAGRFSFAVTFFLTVGTVPSDGARPNSVAVRADRC